MAQKTPAEEGYYMPAEWERQDGIWLQWPHNAIGAGYHMKLEHIWLNLVHALHQHENVFIIVTDENLKQHVEHLFDVFQFNLVKISIYVIPTNDVWARDNGPIFVVNKKGQLAITGWNFNGWGRDYPHQKDCQVPAKIADLLKIPIFKTPIITEGGAIEVNGKGSMMATLSSIVNENRNPGKSRQEIETAFSQYLGITNFIWLSGAPGEACEKMGDGTDYHVDIAARFVNPSTVLYAWTDDTSDLHYPYLVKHHEELKQAKTETGEPLTLIKLPLPKKGVHATWEKSWVGYESKITDASYCNYLVTNKLVLVPVYGNVNDEPAKHILGSLFPGRKVIGIPSLSVTEEGGAMHCISQQQPAVN
jgi:agmatine deiminase